MSDQILISSAPIYREFKGARARVRDRASGRPSLGVRLLMMVLASGMLWVGIVLAIRAALDPSGL